MNEELLTVNEVLQELRVSRGTFMRYVLDGDISVLRYGGPKSPIRVRRSELDRFLSKKEHRKDIYSDGPPTLPSLLNGINPLL